MLRQKNSIANIRSLSSTPAARPAKPKGIKHTTAGYNLYTKMTTRWVFDLQEDDVYWCTADCGWITGHSYIVYGPLANGATVVMYEGAPNSPDEGRFWEIGRAITRSLFSTPRRRRSGHSSNGATILSIGPTSRACGLLGTVGEGINPEAWMWYHRVVGGERCPIVDTWWQTETGWHHDEPASRRHSDQTGQLHQTPSWNCA